MVSFLKRANIEHLARAVAAITNEGKLVFVGTGTVIARTKNLPLELTQTRELDIQMPDDERGNNLAPLVDASIGEGSMFDATTATTRMPSWKAPRIFPPGGGSEG